jgi:hypothetical protein
MKKVGSTSVSEYRGDETPDDLSIPDFLRRPLHAPEDQRVENRRRAEPPTTVN